MRRDSSSQKGALDDSHMPDGCSMGEDGAVMPWQAERSLSHRRGQPAVPRRGAVDRADRQPVAGFAGTVRQVEYGLHALSQLGKGQCSQENLRSRVGRSKYGVRHGLRHNRQGPLPRSWLKKGTKSQAIGSPMAVGPPRSWRSPTHWANWPASTSCRASATTRSGSPR